MADANRDYGRARGSANVGQHLHYQQFAVKGLLGTISPIFFNEYIFKVQNDGGNVDVLGKVCSITA